MVFEDGGDLIETKLSGHFVYRAETVDEPGCFFSKRLGKGV